MRTNHVRLLSAIASVTLAVGILSYADPAMADIAPPSRHVAYTQHDLATAEGRETLRHRIADAAFDVCSTTTVDPIAEMQCRDRASTRAMTILNARIAGDATAAAEFAAQ